MSPELKTINAEIINSDSKNSLTVKYLNKEYHLKVNNPFRDSFNIIETILNNPNQQSYDVEFSNYNDIIYNVYNFPNPFVNKTFFTFGFANSESITAKVIVYALNGEKIYNTTEYLEHNNNHFYSKLSNSKGIYHMLHIFHRNLR